MRYFIGFIAIILVLVALFVFILRGGSSKKAPQLPQTAVNLTSLIDKNSEVDVTVEGRVVGEDAHRSVRLSVTPTSRTEEVLKGYENTVDRSQNFANTQAAYDVLMHSLQEAGFTKSKSTSGDEKALCPNGFHYTYEVKVEGQTKSRLWSNACNVGGTFSGNGAVVRQLLQDQMPDYDQFVSGVEL